MTQYEQQKAMLISFRRHIKKAICDTFHRDKQKNKKQNKNQ